MTLQSAPETAPALWYRDPSRWPVERAAIFAKSWQFVTHESALAETGSWRAETLAGYPIIVVRDEKGGLRAFHNVCRHRAGPLVSERSGVCDGALTCRYHGWRYALDGRLRQARDFGPAAGFDPRDFALFPVRVECWRGLLFVCIEAEAPALADLMAPVERRLGDRDWSNLRVGLERMHVLDCNWKTYVENYLEGYHVPIMHPSLDRDIRSEAYRVWVEGRVALHEAPPREQGVYDGVWAWVWPNIGVNVYQSGVMIERMSPIGPAQTRLDYFYLTPGGAEPTPETLAMSDDVTAEDKWIVERVQENLNAGVYQTGRLSPKHEGAVAAFQAWVAEAIGNRA
ncbi:MAG: Rieske 2Fe-2S domain-containing protein [Hyphomonadaceae bacterium]|nr:Rieske 2Fe-2S domain-containing protein [Hyphomonadaceae bacterium]